MHSHPRTKLTPVTRLVAGIGVGGLITIGLAAPALAAPAYVTAPATALQTVQPAVDAADTSCEVSAATLNWGIKESFRSYVSGSIANGEWTVSDDMRYETPDFIWDKVSGSVDSTLETGSIGFTGAVHFTGHDGAMELDLANPSIEFEGADTAYLLFSIGATDTADSGGVITAAEVRGAKLDLTGAVTAGGESLAIEGAVPRLTAEGAAALNGAYGSYVAGEELDPINMTATVAGCDLGAQTAVAPTEPEQTPIDQATPVAAEPEAPQIPWLPIGIGAVALLVIGVTGGMLLGGRGKKNAAKTDSGESAAE